MWAKIKRGAILGFLFTFEVGAVIIMDGIWIAAQAIDAILPVKGQRTLFDKTTNVLNDGNRKG